jgi:hypothetical protein
MKRAIGIILQTLLFFMLFFAGSFFPPLHLQSVVSSRPVMRVFIWDGVVMMLVVYVVLLLAAAFRKRLSMLAPWTTLALGIATVLGLAAKFGFKTMPY